MEKLFVFLEESVNNSEYRSGLINVINSHRDKKIIVNEKELFQRFRNDEVLAELLHIAQDKQNNEINATTLLKHFESMEENPSYLEEGLFKRKELDVKYAERYLKGLLLAMCLRTLLEESKEHEEHVALSAFFQRLVYFDTENGMPVRLHYYLGYSDLLYKQLMRLKDKDFLKEVEKYYPRDENKHARNVYYFNFGTKSN